MFDHEAHTHCVFSLLKQPNNGDVKWSKNEPEMERCGDCMMSKYGVSSAMMKTSSLRALYGWRTKFVNFSCAILLMASFSKLCQTRESTTAKRTELHIDHCQGGTRDFGWKKDLSSYNCVINSLLLIWFSSKLQSITIIQSNCNFHTEFKIFDHKSFDWYFVANFTFILLSERKYPIKSFDIFWNAWIYRKR